MAKNGSNYESLLHRTDPDFKDRLEEFIRRKESFKIEIKLGDKGCDYETIFVPFFNSNIKRITLQESYIKNGYQVNNISLIFP